MEQGLPPRITHNVPLEFIEANRSEQNFGSTATTPLCTTCWVLGLRDGAQPRPHLANTAGTVEQQASTCTVWADLVIVIVIVRMCSVQRCPYCVEGHLRGLLDAANGWQRFSDVRGMIRAAFAEHLDTVHPRLYSALVKSTMELHSRRVHV